MMKRYRLQGLLLIAAVSLILSCNNTEHEQERSIEKLEAELFDEEAIFSDEGNQKALELVRLYLSYAEQNPEDTLSPAYLFKAADITMNLGDPGKAIGIYNKIIYTYPDYPKLPECHFLVAYIYENFLQNYGKATELYQQFIEKYPDNEFADDAEMSIKNMGKSPEELIKEFEARNEGTEL